MVIPGQCAGVRDDGFAGGGHLRRRNCAVGGEWLADREVGVRASPPPKRRKDATLAGCVLPFSIPGVWRTCYLELKALSQGSEATMRMC